GLVKLCRKPTATASTCCAARVSIAPTRLASSSGSRTSPCASIRSRTARRNRRGTSGGRQVDIDVVLLETVLMPDFEHVAEAFGGEKRGFRALALDQRIGGERRAVNDQVYLPRRHVRFGSDRAQRGEHALFRRLRRGQNLCRKSPLAHFQRDVG